MTHVLIGAAVLLILLLPPWYRERKRRQRFARLPNPMAPIEERLSPSGRFKAVVYAHDAEVVRVEVLRRATKEPAEPAWARVTGPSFADRQSLPAVLDEALLAASGEPRDSGVEGALRSCETTIDAAPATYRRPAGGGGVLACEGSGWSVTGIVDGFGSWGYGMEAADWVSMRLVSTWRSRASLLGGEVANDVTEAAAQLPPEWQAKDEDCAFSVALLLTSAAGIEVIAAGAYNVARLDGAQITELFRARRWIEEQVSLGVLPADALDTHPLREVMIGPFVADTSGRRPDVLGPFEAATDARFLVAHHAVLRRFMDLPVDSRPTTALGIQKLGTDAVFNAPVVYIAVP
jgi:hypothetical protein